MKISSKKYAVALFDVLSDVSEKEEIKKRIKKFVEVLVENNHISQGKSVVGEFVNIWNKENSLLDVEITSAKKLDKSVVELLNSYIIKKINVESIDVTERIDKKIKGGFVVRAGDLILDSSLKTRLDLFRDKLCS